MESSLILVFCFFLSHTLYPICQGILVPVLSKYIQYFVTFYFPTLAILVWAIIISWLDCWKGILNRSHIFYSCPQQSVLKTATMVIDALIHRSSLLINLNWLTEVSQTFRVAENLFLRQTFLLNLGYFRVFSRHIFVAVQINCFLDKKFSVCRKLWGCLIQLGFLDFLTLPAFTLCDMYIFEFNIYL